MIVFRALIVLMFCLSLVTPVVADDAAPAQSAPATKPDTTKADTPAKKQNDDKKQSDDKSDAASAKADSAQETDDTQNDPTQDVWNIMLQNRAEELKSLDTEVVALLKKIPAASKGLKEALDSIEDDYRRLLTISQVSRSSPMELTVVQERLVRLQDRLIAAQDPLDGALGTLKNRLDEISLMQQDMPGGAASVTPEFQGFLKDLTQTQGRLSTLQTRLNRVLKPAKQLGDSISVLSEKLNTSIPSLWQQYYLNRTGRLYDADSWGSSLQKSLSVLQETFAVRMSAELPSTLRDWFGVLVRWLTLFLPLMGVIMASRRLSSRWPETLRTGWIRLSTHSLIWLSLGFSFHFSAWSAVGNFHVLSVIGTLLLSLGQMALAWDMYTFDRNDLQRYSPLWPLFAPLLGGLMLLLFNLPGPVLGVLWLLVLGITLWQDHKRPLPDIPFPLVINLLRFQMVLLWVAVLLTLLGWGRLSILVNVSYAALAVCLQQAIGFMRITNIISEQLPQQGLTALLLGLVLALALPTMIVLTTLATGLWILAYPGGQFLLSHWAQADFSIGTTTFNTLQILFILSAFYVTRSVISVGSSFISELPQHGMRMEHTLIGPIQVAFTYLLWGLFGLYTLSALGFSLTSLAVVAGGLSVGIGFGLQNIINNFFSGLLMIFGQTLREGDVIEVGQNLTGTVKKINVRSTMLETPDNAIIFVPNAEFLSGRLTNWTRNGRMVRLEIKVGVAYGSNVEQVIQLLHKIADDHPKVLSYPEPMVVFTDFGASSLDFALRFWIGDILHGLTIKTDLRVAIDRIFAENHIEIAFPQLDLHVREFPPAEKDAEDRKLVKEKVADSASTEKTLPETSSQPAV